MLRQALDLTQQKFAEQIGVKRNTVANYETGRNTPIDAIVSSICRQFNVNEQWLRTGKGDMFNESDTFNLDEYAKHRGVSEYELHFAKTYFSLPLEFRTQMLESLRKCVERSEPTSGQTEATTSSADAQIAELKRQNQQLQQQHQADQQQIQQLQKQQEQMDARLAALEEEDASQQAGNFSTWSTSTA